MHTHGSITRAVLASLLLSSAAFAGTWPRFRGPNGQGISDARTLPIQWTDEDYAWKIDLPGTGPSSPVWLDNRLYCITREGRCVVLQAGRNYSLLAVNDLGEPSDATPAVADERMYLRTSSRLMCLTAKRQ
ncbi:MAG TPA: hypothetical protein ENN81_08105 [Phycisphaerales bacterium]|nr:hypothetical protein [Phycisphaerales bacterium]